eukprot:14311455-Ditylum_brightwellii.AAC.1
MSMRPANLPPIQDMPPPGGSYVVVVRRNGAHHLTLLLCEYSCSDRHPAPSPGPRTNRLAAVGRILPGHHVRLLPSGTVQQGRQRAEAARAQGSIRRGALAAGGGGQGVHAARAGAAKKGGGDHGGRGGMGGGQESLLFR